MIKHLITSLVALGTTLFVLTAAALDVNRASSDELQTVDGIGPVLAERIVRERSRGGKFNSQAELVERVKGIGDKTASNIGRGSGLKKGSASSSSSKTSRSKATTKTSSSKKNNQPSQTATGKTAVGKASTQTKTQTKTQTAKKVAKNQSKPKVKKAKQEKKAKTAKTPKKANKKAKKTKQTKKSKKTKKSS